MPEPAGGARPITLKQVTGFRRAFETDPLRRVALNAVTKTSVRTVAMNREAVVRCNHTFSHVVKAGEATSQNASGRCWLFAGLNTMRIAAAERMNLENFELSQNYLMFWDKLEKANYFLESILKTLDEATDSRLIMWLMQSPVQDGGQWDMFANVVRKYGVVPKEVMPETESSSNTGVMNSIITQKLREDAFRLREWGEKGVSVEDLRARKDGMLEEVHRMLCIHLGVPPQSFLWQWRDKDKAFHRAGVLTPLEFTERYVQPDLDNMVCLIHCPQSSKQFNAVYTIEYLGNVLEGEIIRYLNVELPVMKQAAVKMIMDGKPVWFGCDVGKMFDRDLGLMDTEIFEFEPLYGMEFGLNKAERLDYGQSAMNHAMVFTGVDLDDDGKPVKWRVENSWGDKPGNKGFMVMTDRWFDEYNYEVAVEKKYLSPELLEILRLEPIKLPPWDPMGALA